MHKLVGFLITEEDGVWQLRATWSRTTRLVSHCAALGTGVFVLGLLLDAYLPLSVDVSVPQHVHIFKILGTLGLCLIWAMGIWAWLAGGKSLIIDHVSGAVQYGSKPLCRCDNVASVVIVNALDPQGLTPFSLELKLRDGTIACILSPLFCFRDREHALAVARAIAERLQVEVYQE